MKRQGYVQFYRSRGQWRWRVVAANGRKLANGGEAYRRRVDAVRGASAVMFRAGGWDWRFPT